MNYKHITLTIEINYDSYTLSYYIKAKNMQKSIFYKKNSIYEIRTFNENIYLQTNGNINGRFEKGYK